MKYLHRICQLFIVASIIAVLTLFVALVVTIRCTPGNEHFQDYYSGRQWGRLVVRVLPLPVKVGGRKHLGPKHSYVFVGNYRGTFGILLIYGFLGRNLRRIVRHRLRKVPFIGRTRVATYRIFIDKCSPGKAKETYDKAHETLQDGMPFVVFLEGSRMFAGHIATFKREAFMLANDLQLPIVPLTINGSFNVMPHTRDIEWVSWHPLRLTVRGPTVSKTLDVEHISQAIGESYRAIISTLAPEHQGFVENSDQ